MEILKKMILVYISKDIEVYLTKIGQSKLKMAVFSILKVIYISPHQDHLLTFWKIKFRKKVNNFLKSRKSCLLKNIFLTVF